MFNVIFVTDNISSIVITISSIIVPCREDARMGGGAGRGSSDAWLRQGGGAVLLLVVVVVVCVLLCVCLCLLLSVVVVVV